MYTTNISITKVYHFHGKNELDEMKFISERIKQLTLNNIELKDIAILYRSHYLSRYLEQGLVNAGIDYVMYGGVKFFERKEIKDVLSYLKIIVFNDDLSFERVINVPARQIGKAKMKFIKEEADKQNISYYDFLKNNLDMPIFQKSGAKEFVNLIEKYNEGCRMS